LLQVPGTQAAFINYVVCLAVVQGIKEATQHLVQVRPLQNDAVLWAVSSMLCCTCFVE
jgi:hypothetical protein